MGSTFASSMHIKSSVHQYQHMTTVRIGPILLIFKPVRDSVIYSCYNSFFFQFIHDHEKSEAKTA